MHTWQAWHAQNANYSTAEITHYAHLQRLRSCNAGAGTPAFRIPVCKALSRFGGDLNRDLLGLTRVPTTPRKEACFRSLIRTRTTQQRSLPFDRDTHTYTRTHYFEPDPRWSPPKKGQRNTASLPFNFLADCQHSAQLAAVSGLLSFFSQISRTLASVCLFVCLFNSFLLACFLSLFFQFFCCAGINMRA